MSACRSKLKPQAGESPLDFVLRIMRDESQPLPVRLDAARIALPYCHPKLHALTSPEGTGPTEVVIRHFHEVLPEETKRQSASAVAGHHSEKFLQ